MLRALGSAIGDLFSPAFRGLVVQAILFAGLIFVALAALVWWLADSFLPTLGWEWVNTTLEVVAPLLTLLLAIFLGAPVAAIYVGIFLETIADRVEAKHYPADPAAKGATMLASLTAGLGLALTVLAVTVVTLPLHLVPVVGTVIVVLINATLLGREFFELVGLRHRPPSEVQALRKRHGWRIFFGGLVAQLVSMVPLLNLVAPLFATALFVHLHRDMTHGTAAR